MVKKSSQRRPPRHERDQAGCIWSLIRIFDFRQDRSARRLLSDKRRVSNQAVGGDSKTERILLGPTENVDVDTEESKIPVADVARTSVKELMEEEMVNEHSSTALSNEPELRLEQFNPKYRHHLKKSHHRKNRSRNNSSDLDDSDQKTLDNVDLERIMDELVHVNKRNTNCMKNDLQGDLDIPTDEVVTFAEEDIVAAVKLFIERQLSNDTHLGEEGFLSKEFLDTLQTLTLNKGLFLKLLKDPNSVLVRHINSLKDARIDKDETPAPLPAPNLSQENSVNLKHDDFTGRKHRNIFRRRSRSLESYPSPPSGGDKDFQPSSKIVILKAGSAFAKSPETDISISLQSHYMDSNLQIDRTKSQFSFTEIKRKLRQAMGKEKHGVSPDKPTLQFSPKHQNGTSGGETLGWSSPNRDHFYTEKFTMFSPSFKKVEPIGKLKENGSAVVNDTCKYRRLGVSNIYIEAKKHLSDMLKNGDENAELVTQQLPKSLGRILSLPEYNGSPCSSPRGLGNDIIRLSPRGLAKKNVNGLLQENFNNHPSPSRQSLKNEPCIFVSEAGDKTQSLNMDVNVPLRDDEEYPLGTKPFTDDTTFEARRSPAIVVEIEGTTDSGTQEEETIVDLGSKSSSSSITGDVQNGDCAVDNEESASHLLEVPSQCFKTESFVEDQALASPTVSPSPSPVREEVNDSYCPVGKEQPSPISVLEPLVADADISPTSSVSKPVEKEIEPRNIHFEEPSSATNQGICIRISLEDEESAFEYVEAVLLGSGLNWDEFLLRWLSLYKILDSSLFEEVELFSSRPRHDQKLLFDCANEALTEVCESYFGCFTGISQVKQNVQKVPKGMDLINEVWKRVECHMSQHPQPHSLDKLVKRDLASPGHWMNLKSDVEHVGFEMAATIFDELVEDVIGSFVDDASECEFVEQLVEYNQLVSN